MEKNRAVTMLLASAAILGLDKAITLLQNERNLAGLRIDQGRRLTIGDLADLSKNDKPTFRSRPKRRTYTRAVPDSAKPLTWNGNVTAWRNACKEVLSDGPQKLRVIVRNLKKHGIVRDDSTETKREVRKYLEGDKTFSIRTTGVYALRTRSV